MLFDSKDTVKTDCCFTVPKKTNVLAHPCLNKSVIKEFWSGFNFGVSELEIVECEDFVFSIGNAEPLALDGNDYSINVTVDGICVYAESEGELIRGFMTLVDRIRAVDAEDGLETVIDCATVRESALIKNRMVHFCIFPETELWELERFIRYASALKYSHIIVEFWGMLKYDCMGELSWSHAYEKEQIRPMISLANDLGLEIIPMFNHWGHAAASRVMYGKHVVLDQNPALCTYFSDDGWCWDICKPKVRALLRSIREELIELCGDGEYFHIGCDEAFGFDLSKPEGMDTVCDFINEISRELALVGRRAIAWGDMFINRHEDYNKNAYFCLAPSRECEKYMHEHLDKNVIIADWQYDCTEAPVQTALTLKAAGFDTLLCPWDRSFAKVNSCVNTAKQNGLFGIIHTTWNTLDIGTPYVLVSGVGGYGDSTHYHYTLACNHAATLLRKVYRTSGDYRRTGWHKKQI